MVFILYFQEETIRVGVTRHLVDMTGTHVDLNRARDLWRPIRTAPYAYVTTMADTTAMLDDTTPTIGYYVETVRSDPVINISKQICESGAIGNFTASSECFNESNATTVAPPGSRDEELAKIEIIVQAVILFLAVFGNGLVLLILCTRHKKLSRMNMMIVHLSIADLFVAFFNVLPQMIWDVTFRFRGNNFLCKTVKYFQVVAMYASSYVLVTTALDRYLAIVHPMTSQTWTSTNIHALVGVAWALSLAFSIPQLSIFSYQELGAGQFDCWAVFYPKWTVSLYITWITTAIYIIPFGILTFAYGRICFVVWKSMRAKEPSVRESQNRIMSWKSKNAHKVGCQLLGSENGSLLSSNASSKNGNGTGARSNSGNPRAHVRGLSKAKVKTVKLTLTVIICYLVCWGPFFVAQMWSVWDPAAPFNSKYKLHPQKLT